MRSKIARFSECSIVGLLLAMATALFIGSKAESDFIVPHDPVFGISIRYLFWIGGSILLAASLLISVNNLRSSLPFVLSSWFAIIFLVYQCGSYCQGGSGLTGCLDGLASDFGLSAKMVNALSLGVATYLLLASLGAAFLRWQSQNQEKQFLKISCPTCGGHVKFPIHNLGTQIPCPHCSKQITLRKPDAQIKSSCFFCQGHFEFPAHAIGEKMPCPHCRMDITLKEFA